MPKFNILVPNIRLNYVNVMWRLVYHIIIIFVIIDFWVLATESMEIVVKGGPKDWVKKYKHLITCDITIHKEPIKASTHGPLRNLSCNTWVGGFFLSFSSILETPVKFPRSYFLNEHDAILKYSEHISIPLFLLW